jgi:large subunit ribosomal protein L18
MSLNQKKTENRIRRHARVRAKVFGTAALPRLAVFKSNNAVYAQMIDDVHGVTLAAASSLKLKGPMKTRAEKVGAAIAEAGIAKKISKVVFDRGGFLYTGNIKALADAARKAGLTF